MTDQFYTPPALAALLTGAAKIRRAGLVADFAMGDGALLRAAETRWPKAQLFGSDINASAAASAGDLGDRIRFQVVDFLEDPTEGDGLMDLEGRCDVVLLNPPFTCRGNSRHAVMLDDARFEGSKALVFVARALRFLATGGELLAILPASCLTSQRDANLYAALQADYSISQVGEIQRNAFAGCSVCVALVRIRKRSVKAKPVRRRPSAPPVVMKTYGAQLMRGNTPMHRTSLTPIGLPIIHTVDLRNEASAGRHWTTYSRRIVQGPVVLLPRVGRPDLSKIVGVNVEQTVLSDCVIAIKTTPAGHEQELLRLLRSNWVDLRGIYGGSCAPYITLDDLAHFLMRFGISSEITDTMAPSERASLGGRAQAAVAA